MMRQNLFNYLCIYIFIEFVPKWWLVVNKSNLDEIKTKDYRRAPIQSSTDWQIKFLDDVPNFSSFLCKQTGKRIKKLYQQTLHGIKHTSLGMSAFAIELVKSHECVLLKFKPIIWKRQFGKYWQCGPLVPILYLYIT